eukprot:2425415-Pleurochrysis_carterae.AAC.2
MDHFTGASTPIFDQEYHAAVCACNLMSSMHEHIAATDPSGVYLLANAPAEKMASRLLNPISLAARLPQRSVEVKQRDVRALLLPCRLSFDASHP